MNPITKFTDVRVWQQAHGLALLVYRISSTFPREESFGLTSQVRRAAVSVSANIAEGFKRYGRAEQRRFYNIAAASLEELRAEFLLVRDLGYATGDSAGSTLERIDQTARSLAYWMKPLH